jgi:hypothetical protein
MSVKVGELENAERDLNLANREPRGARKVATDVQRAKHGTPTAEEELQALRARIAELRAQVPNDTKPCLLDPFGRALNRGDCFERGWAAALQALEE